MSKVRAWFDAGLLAGDFRDVTKAPAWPEYTAAFKALLMDIEQHGDD